MEIGLIGLGKIGANLALQCLDKGILVIGLDKEDKTELAKKGLKIVKSYSAFVANLKTPRTIFLLLPAGETVSQVINQLVPFLDKGDLIVDGGNSFYKDSIEREKELIKKGIYFVDCGTSGGVAGARHGSCLMVGGKSEAINQCETLLRSLCVKDGFIHVGSPGSGHFAKLVHNGIEFGMMQAIGEGLLLLENSDFSINSKEVFRVWSHGSVIRSWLIELLAQGLSEQELEEISDYVEDTGEVNWLIEEAIEKELPIPIIVQSVLELFKSRETESVPAKAVAIMRHNFGGHPFGKNNLVAEERKKGRKRC